MADEEPTTGDADDLSDIDGDIEAKEPRPPIVIPKATRLLIGAVVIVVGLVMLIAGEAVLKVIGVVLIAGGVFDIVVGQRQRV
jgi:hypothetical protein